MASTSTWEALLKDYEHFCGGDKQHNVRRMVNAWKLGLLDGGMNDLGSAVLTPAPTPATDLLSGIHSIVRAQTHILTSMSFQPSAPIDTPFTVTPQTLDALVWGSYGPQLRTLMYLDAVCMHAIAMLCLISPCYRAHFCRFYWTRLLHMLFGATPPDVSKLDMVWRQVEDDLTKQRHVQVIAHMLTLCQFKSFMPYLDSYQPLLDDTSKRFYRFFWPKLELLVDRVFEPTTVERHFSDWADQLHAQVQRALLRMHRENQVEPPIIETLTGGVKSFAELDRLNRNRGKKQVPDRDWGVIFRNLYKKLWSDFQKGWSAGNAVDLHARAQSDSQKGRSAGNATGNAPSRKAPSMSLKPPKSCLWTAAKYVLPLVAVGLVGGSAYQAGPPDVGKWWQQYRYGSPPGSKSDHDESANRLRDQRAKAIQAHINSINDARDRGVSTYGGLNLIQFITHIDNPDFKRLVTNVEAERAWCADQADGTYNCDTVNATYQALQQLDDNFKSGDQTHTYLQQFAEEECMVIDASLPKPLMDALSSIAKNTHFVPLPFTDTTLCVVKTPDARINPFRLFDTDTMVKINAAYSKLPDADKLDGAKVKQLICKTVPSEAATGTFCTDN
jgi:hypothetical protein